MKRFLALLLGLSLVAPAFAQTTIRSTDPPRASQLPPGHPDRAAEMLSLGWRPEFNAQTQLTDWYKNRQGDASRPAVPFSDAELARLGWVKQPGSSSWTHSPPSLSDDPSSHPGVGGAASCRYCKRKVRAVG